ncbi:hypothetical protein BHM03_00058765 [Ensete ventricosum]|nr:hypothetical protein BHM03_00058765 [Ensete ventricosum]
MGSRTRTISRKNVMVINFKQSHVQSRVLIDFSCTVSKFQNTSHSQCIIPWIHNVLAHGMLSEHSFAKKCAGHKLCAKSLTKSSFDRFFVHRLQISKYWPFRMY